MVKAFLGFSFMVLLLHRSYSILIKEFIDYVQSGKAMLKTDESLLAKIRCKQGVRTQLATFTSHQMDFILLNLGCIVRSFGLTPY